MTAIGYQFLIDRYVLKVPPLQQVYVGASKSGVIKHVVAADGSERIEMPRNRYAADDSLAAQLTFAFKREHLNPTVLAALFAHAETVDAVRAWLQSMPTSAYARLAAHLAKWLTGAAFDFRLPAGAQRVRVLDAERYVVGPEISDVQFGVINNLLGTPAFCPIVRRSEALHALLARPLQARIAQAVAALEPEMLARAIDYLYLAETRSTFSIEKETPDATRAERFRRLLEHAGAPGTLTDAQLAEWQNGIVSPWFAEGGYRAKQNWLSRSGRLRNIADFIPPPPAQLPAMMAGIAKVAALGAENKVHPAIAAACAAFGLAFAHPFMDGNGRLHRFLLHHVLRQSGYTPAGVVLPLSARMLGAVDEYSRLLRRYSQPRTACVDYVLDDESQTILIREPQPAWLYASFDATELCEFILRCIEQCVEEDLAKEVAYLRAYDRAKGRLDAWLDLPQPRLNLLIQLIVQGQGALSVRKRKQFEDVPEALLARAESVVREEFDDYLVRSR